MYKPEYDNEDIYCKFGGGYHPFSNFYPAPVEFEGLIYSTGEGAFQAAKTLEIENRKSFQNIPPGVAKKMGRRLKLRKDWEEVKYKVMVEILKSKFSNGELQKILLDTGDRYIIENTSRWHDNIWGNCECEMSNYIEGQNLLGKALMEVRCEIRRHHSQSHVYDK